jgi:Protein of unknown function (DUF3108)
MAAWLKPLLWALLAALLLHIIGLMGVGSQMHSAGALAQKSDPLFTRTIEAASPQANTAPPEPPAAVPALARAPSSAVDAAMISQPVVTETVMASPPASQSDTATLTAAEATPSAVIETLTTQVTTPTQTLSAQPAGTTDSLLITGNWPADTRLSYKLTGYYQGELFGSGQVQWTREGASNERYQVRVTVDAGLYELRMTSQGRVSPQGLLPEAFEEYSKRVLGNPRIRPLKLEDTELVLEGNRRVPRPAAEPLAVQDAVSQFIDLGHRFMQGKAKLEGGENVRIWLGRPGGLDEWTYDISPAETMNLPRIGAITVHELKPRPLARPRGSFTMSMWLAPSLQYLPAKIRIQLGAENFVELTADQIQQR